MKRRLFLTLAFILSLAVHAQIGYQVSLLNSKTGEPHVNPKSVIRISLCRTAKRNPLIFPI